MTPPSPRLKEFLARAGLAGALATPLPGGGRHEVLRLVAGSRNVVLKLHEVPGSPDGRDPFVHEWRCHQFISACAPGSCPAILASDPAARAILFEYIDGERVPRHAIHSQAIHAMASFIIEINQPASLALAHPMGLPRASEAGSSPADHWQSVRRRIRRLLDLPGRTLDITSMQEWIHDEVEPAVERWAASQPAKHLDAPASMVFSPSDFGFHNVLVRKDGRFCFLDFEHAGWDDAAKLCADFVIQPDCPLPQEAIDAFLRPLDASGVLGPDIIGRTLQILPLQAAKWTTIILNPFTHPQADPSLQAMRFAKARSYWNAGAWTG